MTAHVCVSEAIRLVVCGWVIACAHKTFVAELR